MSSSVELSAVPAESAASPSGHDAKYLQFAEKLHSHWKDAPAVTIRLKDVSIVHPIPEVDNSVPNLVSSTLKMFQKSKTKDFIALAPTNLVVKPGSMTLLLAPPGHGKTSLLKAIAGEYDNTKELRGSVLYNNRTIDENEKAGVHARRFGAFVDQVDCHMATLTVQETFEFAHRNAFPNPSSFNDPELDRLYEHRVDSLVSMLGLHEAKDTIIGNALLRGVSGLCDLRHFSRHSSFELRRPEKASFDRRDARLERSCILPR